MSISTGDRLKGSARARQIEASASMALDARAKALKAAGQPIISFGVGEPDFPTPEPVKQAANRALAEDATHYTTVSGDPVLRKIVAERTAELTGVPFAWPQVIVTTGAKEALFIAMQLLCDPGDEVLMPAPDLEAMSDIELVDVCDRSVTDHFGGSAERTSPTTATVKVWVD